MNEPPSYLSDHLTPQQVEAILFRGQPLLIVAGPGSGKTEVMSWRAVHLIRAGLARPNNLLVTTFTNKAALELKDRIQRKLPAVNVELMQVSTLHSFCAALLREYGGQSALPSNFRILTDSAQFLFVYTHRKRLGLAEIVKGRPNDFFNSVIGFFNLATEEMVDAHRFGEWCAAQLEANPDGQTSLWQELTMVGEAYQRYSELLVEQRLADFAFLQRFAVNLLEAHPEITQQLRQRFTDVLVDEYQDTNAAQVRLLSAIVGKDGAGLAVVGDDDQGVYRFRGATVKNLLEFTRLFPNAHQVLLGHNFRSREPIVNRSQQVITHNPARLGKKLLTVRGAGCDTLLIYKHSADEEADAVADVLHKLHKKGTIKRWSDVAILLRSVSSYSGPYVAALQAAGIPHVVVGGGGFFEREEISQLYDLLVRFMGTTKEWGDKFVCLPLLGLSKAAVKALKEHKTNLLESASDKSLRAIGLTDAEDRRRLLALLALKKRVLAKEHSSFLAVFYELLEISGYFARCEQEGNAEVLRNLGILSQLIAGFDEYSGTANYYPFQDYMQLLREGKVEPATEPPPDAVQIMTIHQAKGLEWPVVIVGSVMNGRLPAIARKPAYDIPYDLRASGAPEVDDPHLVDERKLFYVAATRARDLLILSTADVVNKRGGGPSIFLNEMLGDDLRAVADLSQAYTADIDSKAGPALGVRERHSFSQLAYYLQCPLRYKYTVVYGLETMQPDPVDFGANVHRALEALHLQVRAGGSIDDSIIADIVARTWQRSPKAEAEQDRQAQLAAVGQIKRYVSRHASDLARVDRAEVHFAFALEDVAEHVLLGKIDLLRHETDDEFEIVDFKTSPALPVELEQIDTQLDIYALGAEAHAGLKVNKQTVHFLGDDTVQSWGWTDERSAAVRSKLKSLLEQISRHEFGPRTSYCSQCSAFRSICPYVLASPAPKRRASRSKRA